MESWKVTLKIFPNFTFLWTDRWTDIWKAQIWYALPFRRTIREVEHSCRSCPRYVWEVLRCGSSNPLLYFDLWNIGIGRKADYILRVEIIELSWTIPRLMRLEKKELKESPPRSSSHLMKTISNKEVLFS